MEVCCSHSYRLNYACIDNHGIARPSALTELLQEVAVRHATHEGFSPANVFWVLSRLRYELSRPLLLDETLDLSTWCNDIKGATWYRSFSVSVNDEEIGHAHSAWVMLDRDTHRILRPSVIENYSSYIYRQETTALGKLRCDSLKPHHIHTVRYSDLDFNNHLNNVKIIDLVSDALELDRKDGTFLSQLQVNYSAECLPGESISLLTGASTDGTQYVHGEADGKTKFEAAALLRPY